MKDWFKNLFDYKFSEHTEESAKYLIDKSTGCEYNIADIVILLSNKIDELEEKYKCLLLDIKHLEEENIELTNALYEFENSIEAKLNSKIPTVYNIKGDNLENNF